MPRFREAQIGAAADAHAARLASVRAATEARPRAHRWPLMVAIVLCIAIGVMVIRSPAKKPAVVVADSTLTTAQVVEIYTTPSCPICAAAKAYMRQHKLRFTEYDVENDMARQREFYARGGRGVPMIIIGDKSMQGFSPEGFERLRAEAG